MSELKPCPFCGEPPDYFRNKAGAEFVVCGNYECHRDQRRLGGMTPEAWNRRTPEAGDRHE